MCKSTNMKGRMEVSSLVKILRAKFLFNGSKFNESRYCGSHIVMNCFQLISFVIITALPAIAIYKPLFITVYRELAEYIHQNI